MDNIIRRVVVLLSACAIECRADGAESERQALVALEAYAPAIELDESKPGKPVIAVRFRPNAGRVTDDDLVHLKAFPNLRSVELPNKSLITDLGLSHLGGLARLEELNLNGTKVSAAAVVEFVKGRTNLQRLELTGVPLQDDHLAALKDLTAL